MSAPSYILLPHFGSASASVGRQAVFRTSAGASSILRSASLARFPRLPALPPFPPAPDALASLASFSARHYVCSLAGLASRKHPVPAVERPFHGVLALARTRSRSPPRRAGRLSPRMQSPSGGGSPCGRACTSCIFAPPPPPCALLRASRFARKKQKGHVAKTGL